MRSPPVFILYLGFAACDGAGEAAGALERVVVVGEGFGLAESGAAFVPYGFNYDHDASGALLEEYWVERWPEVVADFDEIEALGATVVRVHLQVEAFMTGPETVDPGSLTQLSRLVDVAEKRGLRLDITGLGAYRGSADPARYVELNEVLRWEVQARFWGAIAEQLAGEPAVFAFDLMNEPVVPIEPATDWTPGEFGGLSFVQNLVLELGERDPVEVAAAWREELVGAIRAHDPDVLITVGQLPFGTQPGFTPAEVAADLDYLSVHVYPESGAVEASLGLVDTFAGSGVPVVVEETFPLACSAEELRAFILDSRPEADGWIGFYWGTPPEDLQPPADIPEAILLSWLDLFTELRPVMVGGP